jgi:hypothetical protein
MANITFSRGSTTAAQNAYIARQQQMAQMRQDMYSNFDFDDSDWVEASPEDNHSNSASDSSATSFVSASSTIVYPNSSANTSPITFTPMSGPAPSTAPSLCLDSSEEVGSDDNYQQTNSSFANYKKSNSNQTTSSKSQPNNDDSALNSPPIGTITLDPTLPVFDLGSS